MTTDHNWHRSMLVLIAARMRPRCFVELGLGPDPSVALVGPHCEKAYGVDQAQHFGTYPNTTLLHMTTDQFFADVAPNIEPPDLVFIDADHSHAQVMKDLKAVAAICADNCLVLLHDTYPESYSQTDPGYCGDSYLVPSLLLCENVTLPFPPGLTLCRLKPRGMF